MSEKSNEVDQTADVPPLVAESKRMRKDLDRVLQEIKGSPRQCRERSLAVTKLQEAIMWLGMDLKAQSEEDKQNGGDGQPAPYPQSYNPDSPAIEPTADGLKL